MNVLIVDDEPLAREGIALLLRDEATVTGMAHARNGAEAVAMIRAEPFDAVELDLGALWSR